MGPGARHSTLDDHWSSWNWRKLVDLNSHLLKHLIEALLMSKKHCEIAERFSSTFMPTTIIKWQEMIADWNADKMQPDPYAELTASTTMVTIRLELAEEEALEALQGALPLHDQLTASKFICLGEGVLRNPLKKSTLQEKRNTLTWHIKTWMGFQATYMPVVPMFRNTDTLNKTAAEENRVTPTEHLKLYLLSELVQPERASGCRAGIANKERQFRITSGGHHCITIAHNTGQAIVHNSPAIVIVITLGTL
ncbi:hypothetical protein SCP_1302920 [Sparassis crispa]|uniref:Uncharacterized protein n=1 Tax=Sparassis crispa TaxID=139825 RepID=A0A401H1Z9_9APHY|nr:hypothetical protein SCP_1302920 [Sparassis crispa]GBE88476.1 hypothetical protein SCP_1302920 [Sparassis crispa]